MSPFYFSFLRPCSCRFISACRWENRLTPHVCSITGLLPKRITSTEESYKKNNLVERGHRPLFATFLRLVWSWASFIVSVLWVKLEFSGTQFWETLGLHLFSRFPSSDMWKEICPSAKWRIEQSWMWNSRSRCRVTICIICKDLLKNSFTLNTFLKLIWYCFEYSRWSWEIVNGGRRVCGPWGKEWRLQACWAPPWAEGGQAAALSTRCGQGVSSGAGSCVPVECAVTYTAVCSQSKSNGVWCDSMR